MAAASAAKGCRKIGGAQIRALLEAKELFLFDCDGVLWHGEKAVAGAAQVVNSLVRRGKSVAFVTNNSTRPRDKYLRKFSRLGFTAVELEHIFSSSYCSALYLRDVAELGAGAGDRDRNQSQDPGRGRVFVVGGDGLRDELRQAGVPCVEEADDEPPGATIYDCALAADVKAVLVGHDDRLTFLKLAKASCYLRDPDCLFLASDNDPWHPLSGGRILPGSGSLTAALEVASGRKATVIGKPGRFMFECVSGQFPDVEPARCLMVGDRLETDMLFGSNCGLDTVLTLTGVSGMDQARRYGDSQLSADRGFVPDYVVDTVADFLPALEEAEGPGDGP